MANEPTIQDLVGQYKKYAKDVLCPQVMLLYTQPILGLDIPQNKKDWKTHKEVFADLLVRYENTKEKALNTYEKMMIRDIEERFSDEVCDELLGIVDQLVKNYLKALSGIETRERHKRQDCKTFDIKIVNLSKGQEEDFRTLRKEAKYVINDILEKGVKDYDTKIKSVEVLNSKTGERFTHKITKLPAQVIQGLRSQISNDLSSLAAKKEKGYKVGRRKFTKQVNSLPYNQYGKTHHIVENPETDENGDRLPNHRVKIAGVRGTVYTRGLDQVEGWEPTVAKIVWKADGIHMMLTCYKDKEKKNAKIDPYSVIDIDFGVHNQMTCGDGTVIDMQFADSDTLRRRHRKKAGQKQGSKGYMETTALLGLSYLRNDYKKDDCANKTMAWFRKNAIIITQDDDFRGWKERISYAHGSKKIHKGILGRMKKRMKDGGAIMIPQYTATTQVCPGCHKKTRHELDERDTIVCEHCHLEYPRDAGSALSMESIAYEMFPEKFPAAFSPIKVKGSVEETLLEARRRSGWPMNAPYLLDDPRVLDMILGHVDDKSHVGEDMSGRVKPKKRKSWVSKKKTRGKKDKWAQYSPRYNSYAHTGEAPEHSEERCEMPSGKDSKKAKRKHNLERRKADEVRRARYWNSVKKRRREKERARCEARDAKRLANVVGNNEDNVSGAMTAPIVSDTAGTAPAAAAGVACTPGTGGIYAGGDR